MDIMSAVLGGACHHAPDSASLTLRVDVREDPSGVRDVARDHRPAEPEEPVAIDDTDTLVYTSDVGATIGEMLGKAVEFLVGYAVEFIANWYKDDLFDAQALEGLQQGLSGAAEEGDALLKLRLLRAVLEQEDVRERMPGAEHGDRPLGGRARDLVSELVRLGDRFLQVLLCDFVGGHGRHGGVLQVRDQRTLSLAWAAHLSDWR